MPPAAATRRPRPAVRPSGRPAAVPGLPDPGPWYRLDGVEIFAVGDHREGEPPWAADDLRAIVENFDRQQGRDRGRVYSTLVVQPPDVELGHWGEGDKWLDDTSLPSAGLVESLTFDEGRGLLTGDIGRVPPEIADAVRRGTYFTVSATIYPKPPPGVAGDGPMLKRVGFLGGELPQVKALRPLPTPQPYADAGAPVRHTTPRPVSAAVRVYAEGKPMAATPTIQDALIQRLVADPPPLTAEWLQAVAAKDENLLASLAAVPDPGEATEPDAAGGTPAAPMADGPPPGFDKARCVADILAAEKPADEAARKAELEAMPDADLYALWQKTTGTTMSETKKAARPAPAPLARLEAAFAEKMAALDRRERAIDERLSAREKAERDRAKVEEEKDAQAFCEMLRGKNLARVAELDPGPPEKPNWTLRDEILAHDNAAPVATFSEGGKPVALTARDMFKRSLLQRTPNAYGERVGAGSNTNPLTAELDSVAEEAAKYAAGRNKRRVRDN